MPWQKGSGLVGVGFHGVVWPVACHLACHVASGMSNEVSHSDIPVVMMCEKRCRGLS